MLPSTRLPQLLVVTGLFAVTCSAQRERPKLEPGEQSTILFKITWETDRAQRLALLEDYAVRFPKDEALGWVYEQTYTMLIENQQVDRALAVGEKLMALEPDDVELAYHSLKIAEEKKDAAPIKKWSQIAGVAARRVMASPQDTETGKRRRALAPQVLTYLSYLAYSDIFQATNRAKKLEMMEQFLQLAPSPYTPVVERLYLATVRETDPAKALGIAEKMIGKNLNNEDALILVAEAYLQRDKEPEKVMAYAERVIVLMDQAVKPEGILDADWNKKKAAFTGRAHWLMGSLAMQQNRYAQADKSIRLALPQVRSDPRLYSTALFNLGWANYKMGNFAEAIRFSQECANIKGPFQQQAVKNLAVIRAEDPSLPKL